MISEKPVIDFGVVSESVLSKIWTRLVTKSEVLKTWGGGLEICLDRYRNKNKTEVQNLYTSVLLYPS